MVERLTKLNPSMLTFLYLQNFVLKIDHLMSLNKISTLATLVLEHIDHDDSGASPTIVRDWGRSVAESGAFQKLKVLAFRYFDIPQSTVLHDVSWFPVLTLVGVELKWRTRHGLPERRLQPPSDWLTASGGL
jgi:hypothetical protein